ncbi:unnamed protein product [Schistosoma margrebowiei]|uniref:Uncharacterized protein n=1 Tax=Schistosoma margrebowiei TaxID=48269 RepID=A0A183MW77_9TREM|nr:unnamed protein product [Schistosoma margrebowiei]
MRMKTTSVTEASVSLGLNIHKGKRKVLKHNTEKINPIILDGKALDDVESFTYLGSIMDEEEKSGADVNSSVGKARTTYSLRTNRTQNNYQLIPKSQSSIRMSRQFY